MNQISLKERIENMEILNGGKLSKGQLKIITENKITEIIVGQLYLGSLVDAWDLRQLRDNKITHIFQVI
jgi:hypothetical protein